MWRLFLRILIDALIHSSISSSCLVRENKPVWLYSIQILQVKDVLYHLYKTAVGNLQRLMPKEIRILKYLLTIEDPEERWSALRDAFIPGDELQEKDVDYLYT